MTLISLLISLSTYLPRELLLRFLGQREQLLCVVGVNRDYWIGGSDENHEGLWLWTDGTLMRTGVPLWYHCTSISQQPDGGSSENCAVMRWDSFYHIHDVSCYTSRSVICESRTH
ncbi:hepatic lectin-like [Penaeus monodon]|uniref:hepatic lectin-like n=1 Tax=Penaeus monodon TaxID=6687 RepID=UPI0018A72392|nr:hepatic lectin-like [Penaeus monodon]